jgi:hypothetical protein
MTTTRWVCATCRRSIEIGQSYVRCSVTACNTGRMKLRFCTVKCWNAHVPTARHRGASYVETMLDADES